MNMFSSGFEISFHERLQVLFFYLTPCTKLKFSTTAEYALSIVAFY